MTDKQKLIVDYLADHNGEGYQSDIRDNLAMQFDSDADLENALQEVSDLKLVYKKGEGSLYRLSFPELKVKYAIPHLTLFCTASGEAILRIEDYELFDRFDDMLTEQFDIHNYYHTEEKINDLRICTIFFPDSNDMDSLNKAVRSIDREEVERICRLNNSTDLNTST